LIPASVNEGLRTVDGLQKDRTAAKESMPVRPVPDADVDGLLPYLAPPLKAMVEIQRATGLRPGEVVKMRASDLDKSEDVWICSIDRRKTDWRGHQRIVALGPRTQMVLQPFLERSPLEYLFSPGETLAWQVEQRVICHKKNRRTPIYLSEIRARKKKAAARSKQTSKRKISEEGLVLF
jgi:integrase